MTETVDTSRKSIYKQIFTILLPMIGENILSIASMIVVAALVGRLETSDITAQGVTQRVLFAVFSIFRGIGTGVLFVAAKYYGAGQLSKARRTVEQAIVSAMPVALIAAAFFALFPEPFVRFFTQDAAIVAKAVAYMRLLCLVFPIIAISSFVTAAFQSQGNTKVPLYIAIAMNIVNLVLGWLFIFGRAGAPALGLMGAGIATVGSQLTGALLGLFLLYNSRGGLFAGVRPEGHFLHLERGYLKDIYSMGLPAAAENFLWSFATIILSRVIISYGSAYYAAYQQGLQAESVTEMLSFGFVTAAGALSARAVGSKNPSLLRAYYKHLSELALMVSVPAMVVLVLFPQWFMGLVTNKQDLIAYGSAYLISQGVVQIPLNMNKIWNGFLRAAGNKNAPAVISLIGLWGVRVLGSILAGWVFHWPVWTIWWIISLDICVKAVLSWYFMHKKRALYHIEDHLTPAAKTASDADGGKPCTASACAPCPATGES